MRYIMQLWTGGAHAPAGLARLRKRGYIGVGALVGLSVAIIFSARTGVEAQAVDPTVLDPNLDVRTVVVGLNQPTSMAFLGPNDILVLEKSTGKVHRVVNGVIQSTVLDLAVNSASERGLLGTLGAVLAWPNRVVVIVRAEGQRGTSLNSWNKSE